MVLPIGPHDLGTLPAIPSTGSLPLKGDRQHAFWERGGLGYRYLKNTFLCDEMMRYPNRNKRGRSRWRRNAINIFVTAQKSDSLGLTIYEASEAERFNQISPGSLRKNLRATDVPSVQQPRPGACHRHAACGERPPQSGRGAVTRVLLRSTSR